MGPLGQLIIFQGRLVCLLHLKKLEYSKVKTYLDHRNSYESEWCSILDGIEFALEKNEYVLEVENHNKVVIESLMQKKRPVKPYVVDYFDQILDISKDIDYLAVRWIPRELNKADKLFRIKMYLMLVKYT